MLRGKTPAKLATPSDLNDKGRQAIADALNVLVADALTLYIKSKNFHWHLSGSHFRDYHLLFDEQADQIFAMVDVLAERVRKLGKTTIRSIGHIDRLRTIQDSDEEFVDAQSMLKILLADNQQFIASLRKAHEVCGKNHDVASTSILEVFLDESERRVWFLFEAQA